MSKVMFKRREYTPQEDVPFVGSGEGLEPRVESHELVRNAPVFENLVARDTTEACDDEGRFINAHAAVQFALGGDARFTLKSLKTETRFTFRVNRAKNSDNFYFVSVLNGSDNEHNYAYIGYIRRGMFTHDPKWATRKVTISPDAPNVRAFDYAWRAINRDVIPDQLEIWHEGRCCRCARALTVPESIRSGIGPECAKRV